jgi:large conductance mechanosensitive channel
MKAADPSNDNIARTFPLDRTPAARRHAPMWTEFKEFAVKGNVVDMAVGIMIGGAFTTVVRSLVDDVLMPPLGLIIGNLDFSEQFLVLTSGDKPGPYATREAAKAAGATVVSYGNFINTVISFTIVAFVLFFAIRWMNRLRRPHTPPPPNTRACPFCKSSIDLTAVRCAHCTSELTPSGAPA